jgi:membrane fusion protein, multidrug efflux system
VAAPTASLALRFAARLIGAAIVVSALAATVWVLALNRRYPRTDDAYVRANVVGIAPHVSGPIVELPVSDNQAVSQGDLLFAVDARPYEAALQKARGDLALTESEIAAQQNAIGAAQADVTRREAEAAYAADYVRRLEPLLGRKFVTSDKVEDARAKQRAATAALAEAHHQLERARNLLAQVGELNARREVARAVVRQAELNVEYCRVRAPFDALVTNLNIAVGEYARQGQQVFALIDRRNWYVLANFRETFLDSIRPGMEADVFLPSYPQRRFRGIVQGTGWAIYQTNGATVGVLPAVQPTLNWVRFAQRFPVRIALTEADPKRPFRMGATAVVTIRGRHVGQ